MKGSYSSDGSLQQTQYGSIPIRDSHSRLAGKKSRGATEVAENKAGFPASALSASPEPERCIINWSNTSLVRDEVFLPVGSSPDAGLRKRWSCSSSQKSNKS